ncbi:MAG: insulinase family protein, partial [candidate division Zixibacteria bacterium]|nr:insulinase family protein [candidate division Zixibacteria bacterium]
PKERNVVIEEIKKDMDAPGAPAEEFFTEKAYGMTDFGRPVLGYKPFIENIPREAIVSYWKTYYQPGNMIALLIGDFESAAMKQKVASIFGAVPAAESSVAPFAESHLTGQQRFDTVANVTSAYVNFSFEAPRFGDTSYLPMDLLAQYLSLDEISPLKQALTGGEPLATEVGVSLTTYPGLSRLDINVVSEKPENRELIVEAVLTTLRSLGSLEADIDVGVIDGIKTSVRAQDIYNAEKLHYYGFMIAPMLMTGGWEFIQKYPDLLDAVTPNQMFNAARQWLEDPNYVVTTVIPNADSAQVAYQPAGMTADEVKAHFAATTFPVFDGQPTIPLEYPSTDSVSLSIAQNATFARRTLDNGLTLLIKSSPDSKVFAINALGKNRSANEPDSLLGITDFVNHCLEKGSSTRSATQLSKDLARIGATVTLYDNPWIPYDDRYTTPQFSFFKFETIDQFAPDGMALFADMLLQPAFDSSEVEKIRQSMLGVLGREATSPNSVAKSLYYKTLLGRTGLGKPVMGTMQTIGQITPDDLRSYHARFYSPNNVILAIATSRDTSEVIGWVEQYFATRSPNANVVASVAPPEPLVLSRQEHTELNKEQIGIYFGGQLPGANDPSAVSLEVALSVLSSRLWGNLRERQGLAYSVGAGGAFDRNFGWWYCSMGTSADKFQQAYDGIILEIDKLKLDGPTELELKQTRNQIWGRLMSAKLSRINQAYYMAVNEYLGRAPMYDPEYLSALTKVDLQSVAQAMLKYIRTDATVLATAGKRGGD